MLRINGRVSVLCLIVLLLISGGNAYGWGNKPLVTINGQEYTDEDFRHWWLYWNNNKPAPLPEDPEGFVNFHLMVQQGNEMEYFKKPSYNQKVQVFLKVRTMMRLKRDEVDSKIKISEEDIQEYFKKTYSPIWSIQILTYRDMQRAKQAYQKVTPFNGQSAGKLIFADLQGVSEDNGGPRAYEEARVNPYVLRKKFKKWLEVLSESEAGNIIEPFQKENDPESTILLRVDSVDMPPEGTIDTLRKKIVNKLSKAGRNRYTAELNSRLKKKYEVSIDNKLLEELVPDKQYPPEYLKQNIISMQGFNVPLGVYLPNYHKMKAGQKPGVKIDEKILKENVANTIITQLLIEKESLSRGYENVPPLKWGYEFYKQNRLRGEVEKDIFKKVTVSEEEIEEHYKSNASEYVMPGKVSYAVIEDEEELINKMWAGILTGADYLELAQKYSKKVQSRKTTRDDIPVPFRELIDKLAKGEVGDPVPYENGFALIKVFDRLPGYSIPLNQARNSIAEKIRKSKKAEAKAAYLQKLKSMSTIKINTKVWKKIVQGSKNEKG